MISLISELIRKEIGDLDFKVTIPEFKSQGHFSTNVAFAISKENKNSPMQAAEDLKNAILKNADAKILLKVEVAKPGYINFWLSDEFLKNEFIKIYSQKDNFGKTDLGKGKKAIVEYSSPNIAKIMHVGHMRSTIIGVAIANIHEYVGYEVIRWNYIGDWGTQFGKLIAAYKLWGNKEAIEKDPIKSLLDLYVKFHEELKNNPELDKRGQEEFQKLESGDKENRKVWEWFKEESLKEFEKTYKRLGIKFDVSIGESFYEKELKQITKELLDNGIAKKSEGATIIPFETEKLPPGLIEKSDGASLYLTRDIANLKYRISEYKPSKILYVVASQQDLIFKQLFAIAKMLGIKDVELKHVNFGMVLGSDNKKLATREGKIIPLENLINKSVDAALEIVKKKNGDLSETDSKEIAEAVGIGSLKYNDLSQNRLSDISFDWEKMLNLEGNSSPYLQYTYARLRSILRKSGEVKMFNVKQFSEMDLDLVSKLIQFPDVLEEVCKTYYPNHLTDYLYDLSKSANAMYQSEPVLSAEGEEKETRLALVDMISWVLGTGLGLLGIKTPEKI